MSECTRSNLTPRRRLVVIAASTATVAASAPLLLRYSGAGGISGNVLGLVLGLFLGFATVMLVFAISQLRNLT